MGPRAKKRIFRKCALRKKKISVRNFEDFQKSPRLIVGNIYLHKQTRRFLKILKIVGADFFLQSAEFFPQFWNFQKNLFLNMSF